MVVSVETVAKRYEDVAAGVPISVTIPAYEASDIYVYYGSASLLAVQVTDYTVELGGDFETFTITPTASLIAKIDALIAADPTEENYITVRRALDYKTDATPDGVRYTPFTSREFDRNAMRDAQLAEKLARALVLSPNFVGDEPLLELQSVEPGRALTVNDAGTAIIPGPNAADIADAQANAEIAAAAAAAAALYDSPRFDGTIPEFEASSLAAEGDGTTWVMYGAWGAAVFVEDSVSPDFTNAAGTDLRFIEHVMDVRLWGLAGSGDETTEILAMAQWASDNSVALFWPEDVTYTFGTMSLTGSHDWRGAQLYSNDSSGSGDAITFAENEIAVLDVTADFDIGDTFLTVDDASAVQVGDLVHVNVSRLVPAEHRNSWTEGQLMKVVKVNGNVLHLEAPFVFGFQEATHTGTISAISGDRLTLTLSSYPAQDDPRYNRRRCRITSGSASGEERYIVAKTGADHTIGSDWGVEPWPVGLTTGDSYILEAVATATVYRPNTLKFDGLRLTRDRVFNATDGDASYAGIAARGAFVHMKNSLIDGFPHTGIETRWCYRPRLEDCELAYANRAYGTTGAGSGYGWQTSVCHAPVGLRLTGHHNRRTVDFSGSAGYTTLGLLNGVTNSGGGVCYTGDLFFPEGDVRQSVCGSHGSGHSSRYINCTAQDAYTGVLLRGQKEQVQGFRHFGHGYKMVSLVQGGFGATITDIAYEDQFDMPGQVNYERKFIADKRLMYGVEVAYEGEHTFSQPIVIRGVRANSIIGATVWVDMSGESDVQNLFVSDTMVTCYPDSLDAVEDFRAIGFSADTNLDNCEFKDNYFQVVNAYAVSMMTINMGPALAGGQPVCWIKAGGQVWIDGSVWVNIPDEDIVRLRTRTLAKQGIIDVTHMYDGGSRVYGYSVGIEHGSALNRNPGSSVQKFELLASSPTDATVDVTSGNVGVNYNRDAGTLSIANNVGANQNLIIRGL